jgi:hypothetical protein
VDLSSRDDYLHMTHVFSTFVDFSLPDIPLPDLTQMSLATGPSNADVAHISRRRPTLSSKWCDFPPFALLVRVMGM